MQVSCWQRWTDSRTKSESSTLIAGLEQLFDEKDCRLDRNVRVFGSGHGAGRERSYRAITLGAMFA